LKTLLSLFEGVVRCQHLVPLKIGSFLLFWGSHSSHL
jgi:hypothetical protein